MARDLSVLAGTTIALLGLVEMAVFILCKLCQLGGSSTKQLGCCHCCRPLCCCCCTRTSDSREHRLIGGEDNAPASHAGDDDDSDSEKSSLKRQWGTSMSAYEDTGFGDVAKSLDKYVLLTCTHTTYHLSLRLPSISSAVRRLTLELGQKIVKQRQALNKDDRGESHLIEVLEGEPNDPWDAVAGPTVEGAQLVDTAGDALTQCSTRDGAQQHRIQVF